MIDEFIRGRKRRIMETLHVVRDSGDVIMIVADDVMT